MIVFFDTSALLKLYFDEPGAQEVARLWNAANPACASTLLVPEMLATFARKRREGESPESEQALINALFHDWLSILPIAVDDGVFDACLTLLQKYPLRGADAVHLASAICVRSMSTTPVFFACADLVLIDAAKQERLDVVVTL